MDNMSSLRNFDSVWQRVNPTASPPAPPADDRAVLQRMIQDEYESHSLYKHLASHSKALIIGDIMVFPPLRSLLSR